MSLLSAEGLTMQFGGLRALDDVSFTVAPGQVFSIIGPNGAGKTTIFNLISRLYDASHGRILFDGRDITAVAPHRIAAAGIARTFQNIELFENASVLQNLLLGRHHHCRTGWLAQILFLPSVRRDEVRHRHMVEKIIEFLGLEHYREQRIAGLPYGVRKIVELARALVTEPRLLLLDEPSSGLNVEETDDMAFWIDDIKTDLGITILMVEHDMNLVGRVSDQVLALNYGRVIAAGSPAEVQAHPEVVSAYLGGDDG